METLKPIEMIKLVIVGKSGAGKSSLVTQYTKGVFLENPEVTIVQDLSIITQEEEKKIYKIQIWDTAGMEKFQSFFSDYYKRAKGIMVVIDISQDISKEIFEFIFDKKDINQFAPEYSQKILVANKVDLIDCDKTKQLKNFATELNMPFIITSAKSGFNVKEAFDELIKIVKKEREIRRARIRGPEQPYNEIPGIRLTSKNLRQTNSVIENQDISSSCC